MLSCGDQSGRRCAAHSLGYALLLIPISLIPWIYGLAGTLYFAAALILGGAFAGLALRWFLQPAKTNARNLFLASLLYLPLILGALVLGKL